MDIAIEFLETKPLNPLQNTNESEFYQLMVEARSGNADATAALIERYRPYLLFIANRQLAAPLKTKLGASDVVQESLLHAQMNFEQFHGHAESEFKNWLNAILTNDLRKARRHFATQKFASDREVKLQERSDLVAGIRDPQLTPSSEAIDRETSDALNRALGKLNPNEKTAIELRNMQRLSFVEMGQKLGISDDAARKRWARAIESLKRHLDDVDNNHLG